MAGGPAAGDGRPVLGRRGGLLLALLGLAVLAILVNASQGHRARLAAEGLGVLAGGAATALVLGRVRPSPDLATRAYLHLGRPARALLVAGLVALFGFALGTAGLHRIFPHLQHVPGFGGLVTLDWVVSLGLLATAGSTLFCLGVGACLARGDAPAADQGGLPLERLWAASNRGDAGELAACFDAGEGGRRLLGEWLRLLGPPGTTQVLLVRTATVWGRSWSEWQFGRPDGAGRLAWRRRLLVAREAGGRLAAGELYEPSGE